MYESVYALAPARLSARVFLVVGGVQEELRIHVPADSNNHNSNCGKMASGRFS